MTCTCLFLSITDMSIKQPSLNDNIEEIDRCMLDHLRNFMVNNPKNVTIGHLNINSIPNKFEGIMDAVAKDLDIFLISETKIDSTFPEAQFFYSGYLKPHRKDRNIGEGGCSCM